MTPVGNDGIQSLLAQMREIRSRSALPNLQAASAPAGPQGVKESAFAERLGEALKGVNDKQMTAASTMVAMQKSQVAFRATVEVRNRVVQAYQDVMNMPI